MSRKHSKDLKIYATDGHRYEHDLEHFKPDALLKISAYIFMGLVGFLLSVILVFMLT